MKKLYISALIASMALGMTSCYDLNQEPQGVLSSAAPFKTVAEMQSYLNQFYQSAVRTQDFAAGGGGGIAGNDCSSDNMAANSVNQRMAGKTSLGNGNSLGQYTYIRNVNFLLSNLDNCDAKGSTSYNQCVGEAYYFRAWYYYQMLINYGGVAWVESPLEADLALMDLQRESRSVIADHILADLDQAIANLGEQSRSGSFRIHRDVARALKSEVALFEGTWEKYHKAKNDPFYDPTVTDDKIRDYFTQAAAAAKAVMDRGVWQIYNTGNKNNDYRVIFQTTDLSSNSEVLWFKKYDGEEIGNNVNRYLNTGGGSAGITASLVDDYLTIDGRPFVGQEKLDAKKVWGQELLPTVRDPRLAQTVCTPGQILRPDRGGYTLPPLVGATWNCTTGYSMLKHVQIDYTGSLDNEYKGATPAIQFRYADVLLNYAEALAELGGAANAQAIIDAIHPLRARVGMPDMDFDREYNTDPEYPFAHLDKYIQAVRRERRVEKACEGRRFEDILRWAAADELLVGQWPHGALFIGSNLETAYTGLVWDQAEGNNLLLTGAPGDAYRYIVPMDKADYPTGWQFRVNQDYLLPISVNMVNKYGWDQNPNW
ncbi:MAG: RagB/SusD family nutrient uptake outer membrane protein [Muribaculaceae bacterium]|nr:RagB/SusD family nutrient uptake outer membrane protein [Muribaculaceae bacterium]